MKVRVKYFGMLSEIMGKADEELILEEKATLEDAKSLLMVDREELANRTYKIAVNATLDPEATIELTEGDELSFLPPFAGG